MGPFAYPPSTPNSWQAPSLAVRSVPSARHAERRPLYLAVTKDLAVAIRAGGGLNQQANAFPAGMGFAGRYWDHARHGRSSDGSPVGDRRSSRRIGDHQWHVEPAAKNIPRRQLHGPSAMNRNSRDPITVLNAGRHDGPP